MLYFVHILFNVYHFSICSQYFIFQVSSIFVGLWDIRIVGLSGTHNTLRYVAVGKPLMTSAAADGGHWIRAPWLSSYGQGFSSSPGQLVLRSPAITDLILGYVQRWWMAPYKVTPLQFQKHALFKGVTWPTEADLPRKHSPLGVEAKRADRDGQTYRSIWSIQKVPLTSSS